MRGRDGGRERGWTGRGEVKREARREKESQGAVGDTITHTFFLFGFGLGNFIKRNSRCGAEQKGVKYRNKFS